MIKDRRISATTFLRALLVALALLACVGVAPAIAASAHEAPHWEVLTRSAPTNLPPGKKGEIVAVIVNLGDAPVVATKADPVEITDKLSPGLLPTGPMSGYAARGDNGLGTFEEPAGANQLKGCTALPVLQCTYEGTLPPYVAIETHIPVEASSTEPAERVEQNEVAVEGGNASPTAVARPIKVSAAKTPFGIESYELHPEEEDGSPELQAGSHPFQLTTTVALNESFGIDPVYAAGEKTPKEYPTAPALLRNLDTVLPPGLVADTKASVFPQCSDVDFSTFRVGNSNLCPAETAIGVAVVTFNEPLHYIQDTATVPVFNLVPESAEPGRPESGEPARFGFAFEKVPVILDTALQPNKGYGAEVKVENASQAAGVLSTVVTIWGEPGAPQHDSARGWECLAGGDYTEGLEPRPPCPAAPASASPFLIMPTTTCSQPLVTSAQATSWVAGAKPVPDDEAGFPGLTEGLQGCETLPFEPSFKAQPDQREASTPTGMHVEVTVPQNTTLAAGAHAEADIKDTTVELPEGMLANPGAANGLGVCPAVGKEAIGFDGEEVSLAAQLENDHFTRFAANCPSASKVGTVKIKTPLLEGELEGSVYFAEQDTNPFVSPLVLYVVAEEPKQNVRVKLAGEVSINPSTGQITSVFKNAPPLPFETLELNLFEGPRAAQTTPALCKSNESKATFLPSTGEPAVERSSSFTTEQNPDGVPCPSSGPLPFAPGFQAGSTSSQAAGFTPFTLTLGVPDGDAALKTIAMQLPPGMAAVLASVTPCPEPQAAEGTCGPESLIGHSTASAGLGSQPYTLPGEVFLTGPYGNAPFGLSAVTQAKAGPFDLGKIVARSTITINPETAAATINTEAAKFFPLQATEGEQTSFEGLPQFVKGTPAQIKQLNVTVDRPGFEFNPTNCSPMAITGTLTGYEGTSEPVSYPFQATNCATLPFAPKLSASVAGQGSKLNGTTFSVTVESPGLGQANIHKVDLTIPSVLPSRLTTIQKACLEAVFNANPAACDEGSLIGEGIVHTPVFKNPLRGPAYLVSHGGAAFPDVEFVLQGEGVKIVLDGKTYIHGGVTYSKFETSPDAPFTKFETIFPAGPHSALTPSVPENENFNLCKQKITLPTEITGQNGAFISQVTPVTITGCKGVAGFKVTKAQQLAKALKACKKDKKKSKRVACEKAARKKYGAKGAKKSAKGAKKSAKGAKKSSKK